MNRPLPELNTIVILKQKRMKITKNKVLEAPLDPDPMPGWDNYPNRPPPCMGAAGVHGHAWAGLLRGGKGGGRDKIVPLPFPCAWGVVWDFYPNRAWVMPNPTPLSPP